MKITVIKGTEKHGVTYNLKELFFQIGCRNNGILSAEGMLIITQCLGAVCSAAFIALIIIISVINEAGGKIGGFIVWLFVVFCGGLVFSAIGIVKTKNHYGLKKSFISVLKTAI